MAHMRDDGTLNGSGSGGYVEWGGIWEILQKHNLKTGIAGVSWPKRGWI